MTQTSLPTGNSTSMPFRLCVRAPRTANVPRSSSRRAGHGDLARAGQELARHRALGRAPRPRPGPGDHAPAVLARAGTHVDEPVGRAHHLLVVLDDQHRVAEVAQPLERPDEPVVVALVQADRGLVEDVEHADELRADLGREPDPLRLAARERRGGAVELQVADADVVEEGEARADLLQDPGRDLRSRSVSSSSSRKPIAPLTDICVRSWIRARRR